MRHFELLLHVAFVAGTLSGGLLEPACITQDKNPPGG